jgi:hypothetical protein
MSNAVWLSAVVAGLRNFDLEIVTVYRSINNVSLASELSIVSLLKSSCLMLLDLVFHSLIGQHFVFFTLLKLPFYLSYSPPSWQRPTQTVCEGNVKIRYKLWRQHGARFQVHVKILQRVYGVRAQLQSAGLLVARLQRLTSYDEFKQLH